MDPPIERLNMVQIYIPDEQVYTEGLETLSLAELKGTILKSAASAAILLNMQRQLINVCALLIGWVFCDQSCNKLQLSWPHWMVHIPALLFGFSLGFSIIRFISRVLYSACLLGQFTRNY
jgi:hypothetical protein